MYHVHALNMCKFELIRRNDGWLIKEIIKVLKLMTINIKIVHNILCQL